MAAGLVRTATNGQVAGQGLYEGQRRGLLEGELFGL